MGLHLPATAAHPADTEKVAAPWGGDQFVDEGVASAPAGRHEEADEGDAEADQDVP